MAQPLSIAADAPDAGADEKPIEEPELTGSPLENEAVQGPLAPAEVEPLTFSSADSSGLFASTPPSLLSSDREPLWSTAA